MSDKKSTIGRIGGVVGKSATIPARLVVNRGMRSTFGLAKDMLNRRSQNEYVCPHCTQGFLHILRANKEEIDENGNIVPEHTAIWGCDSCELLIETPDTSEKNLKAVIEEHGATIYAGRSGNIDEQRLQITKQLKKEVFASWVAYAFTTVLALYFIIGIAGGGTSFFYKILCLMFLALMVFVSLGFSFRAWILYNDYLYLPRPAMFVYWLSKKKIYGFPADDHNTYRREFELKNKP